MRRTTRLLVAAVLAVAGAALAFAGAAPRALATVSEAAALPAGAEVEVRGTIEAVDRGASPATFLLSDGARTLRVVSERPLPEHEAGGPLEGRLAVVKGVLESSDGAPRLRATDVQVGCASKYEAA